MFRPPNAPPSPPPPSGSRSSGGGDRGECAPTDLPLVALTPQALTSGGYTTAENPEIWIYLPYQLSSNTPAELRLRDSGDNLVYTSASMTTPSTSGFLAIPITHSLEVGETYEWSFRVFCDAPNMDDVPAQVSGWIQRIEPGAIASDQIWYDLLSAAAVQGRQNPNAPAWANLLNFVEPEGLVGQPVLP